MGSSRTLPGAQADEPVSNTTSPRQQAEVAQPVERAGISNLFGHSLDKHAPTRVVQGVEVVDLKGDDLLAPGRVELGALARQKDDVAVAVVDGDVHGHDKRTVRGRAWASSSARWEGLRRARRSDTGAGAAPLPFAGGT
jgi:hypothetical protein